MIRLVYGLTVLAAIMGLAFGFLGFAHPAFDTFSHFRWHVSLLLLLLVFIGLYLKIKRAPFLIMIFALVGIWQSQAGNRGFRQTFATSASGKSYKLLHYNLRFDNPLTSQVLAMIDKQNADILSLSETSRHWMPHLQTLKTKYPYSFHCPEWNDIGGSMLFSKFPLRSDKNYCHAYAALGLSEVKIDEHWIELGTAHLRWPWPASGPKQITALEPRLKSIGKNALIAGDFNAVPWSWSVNRFASFSHMKLAGGYGGTWIYKAFPSYLAPFFGLPIDLILSKGIVTINSVKTLEAIGSDHLPVIAEFSLKLNKE